MCAFSALVGGYYHHDSHARASDLEIIMKDMAMIKNVNHGKFLSHFQRCGMDSHARGMFDLARQESMGPSSSSSSSSLRRSFSKAPERLPRLQKIEMGSQLSSSSGGGGLDLQRAPGLLETTHQYSPSHHLLIEITAAHCPHLTNLNLINTSHPVPLTFLNRLPNLPRFAFNGYSLTAQAEAIGISRDGLRNPSQPSPDHTRSPPAPTGRDATRRQQLQSGPGSIMFRPSSNSRLRSSSHPFHESPSPPSPIRNQSLPTSRLPLSPTLSKTDTKSPASPLSPTSPQ